MASTRFDVLGIGNAIVDVLARTDDAFLIKQGMHKGGMALIDEPRAATIYDVMGPAIEVSGGSAANTIVGVASLGARAAFVGKVQRRRTRPGVRARYPRCRRFLRYAAGRRRPLHRAVLCAGHTGRRAHHEHLSGRRAGPSSQRYRPGHDRGGRHHLSGGLSLGSAARQGGVPQGGKDRPRRRARRRARRCRMRFASTVTAPNFSTSSAAARSTSSSPTSGNCTACTRPPISTPRSMPCAAMPSLRW